MESTNCNISFLDNFQSDKNNSRLYVYSGVQEILNTDNMPTDNLVYVI